MPVVKFLVLFFLCCTLNGCLTAQQTQPQQAPEDLVTGVYGRIFRQDTQGAGNAWIYAYRSQAGNFRGPADYAARSEADGSYLLDLLPGNWYLVARFREQGATDGPPKVGDAWSIHPGNPVVLNAGQTAKVDFSLKGVSQPMLLRGSSLSSGDTGFRGRLVDAAGKAVTGAVALAYKDEDFRRMPDQTSAAVGEDGRFILYVPQPGHFCLAARQKTRGQPVKGELYGQLGAGAGPCREVVKGEIINVGEIRLSPYLR